MQTLLPWLATTLALVVAAVLGWLLRRAASHHPLQTQLADATRDLRDAVQVAARDGRTELAQALALLQRGLLAQSSEVARTQNEQIDSFRVQLAGMQQHLTQSLQAASDAQALALRHIAQTTEQRLVALQEGNEKKLEQMRATVDEKLHATLEQRLSESFKQVAERLEWVHKGLGEMQALARDVGSLNRTLTGVKTRGLFGETQLAAQLETLFTPDQYAANVAVVPGRSERVDFAIRLPGHGEGGLWLPIDAKFPREDYERLLAAQEAAERDAAAAAAQALDKRLRDEARSIRSKYVAPPHTTDFAVLYVPSEGLYAEALRRESLVEDLQREHHIMLAGPTTLHAMLSSVQMGFRTLALEQRSAEVWEVLGAVKTEFVKFGDALAHTKKKLDEASSSIEKAQTRTRVMTRALKGVEALPGEQVQTLLGAPEEE